MDPFINIDGIFNYNGNTNTDSGNSMQTSGGHNYEACFEKVWNILQDNNVNKYVNHILMLYSEGVDGGSADYSIDKICRLL